MYPPGSLVIAMYGATIGRMGILGIPSTVNQACCVLAASEEVEVRFMYYWFLSQKQQLLAASVGGTQPNLSQEAIKSLRILAPARQHQSAITDFLDRETSEIDELMTKKECLLNKLEEYRFSLIVTAVTKSIPNLPPLWKQARLGRVFRLQRGFDITEASHATGSFPVISSGGFSGTTDRPRVMGPGVVIGRKGTLGTVNYVETDYWPHDTTLFVQDFRGSLPRFVYYFLRYLRLESYDVGAANPTLNRNHVHPLQVRWPDSQSQAEIARHLDQAMPRIDAAAQVIRAAISKLREYRSALISAAVTGQLDIRKHEKQDVLA